MLSLDMREWVYAVPRATVMQNSTRFLSNKKGTVKAVVCFDDIVKV